MILKSHIFFYSFWNPIIKNREAWENSLGELVDMEDQPHNPIEQFNIMLLFFNDTIWTFLNYRWWFLLKNFLFSASKNTKIIICSPFIKKLVVCVCFFFLEGSSIRRKLTQALGLIVWFLKQLLFLLTTCIRIPKK